MERLPFAYVAIGLLVWLAVLVGWFSAFRYFRGRPLELSTKDKVIGFMLAGPFFGSLHSSLGPRGYRLTTRESIGLLAIGGLVLAIIVSTVFKAYAGT